ncbi:hypothetical protein [Rhodovibrio salinarum]|uniref:Lipoprotein n=1 Tax=Rhodovibrio salinarum TaxID=1087 RepID=A0A934QI68_9PROT|nr:hypothetical protein [Rhodovibrio salinarum]MBK1696900.1 hypothetical protein [Rhodovibrio salinarum]
MRSTRFAPRALALALPLLSLAACAGTGVVVNDSRQSGYDPSLIADAASRGGMALEIKGQPFPGAETRFAEVAAEALSESHPGPEFTVFATPADAPEGPVRTVIVANPDATVTPANACTANVSGSAVEAGDTLAVTAALCRGDKAVTRMTGRAIDVNGPDDPKVDQLFRQIGQQLYPRQNESKRDDRGDDAWP